MIVLHRRESIDRNHRAAQRFEQFDQGLAMLRIEPQHLLLALLRDESNGIARLLAEKGVTVEWLRERIAEKVSG